MIRTGQDITDITPENSIDHRIISFEIEDNSDSNINIIIRNLSRTDWDSCTRRLIDNMAQLQVNGDIRNEIELTTVVERLNRVTGRLPSHQKMYPVGIGN